MSDVAILVPVLRRPKNVRPLVRSIRRSTTVPHRTLFICDPGDRGEMDAISRAGGEFIVCKGNYAVKINKAARTVSENLLFLGADDLCFRKGWFEAARAKMADGVGVVGTNDLGNQRVIDGHHSTHSLVARWYMDLGTVDEPGKLLHESYPHEFVDDEFIETAKWRGMFAHAGDSVVEHLHPLWGKASTDALYDAHAGRMRAGRRIYRRRRHLWR